MANPCNCFIDCTRRVRASLFVGHRWTIWTGSLLISIVLLTGCDEKVAKVAVPARPVRTLIAPLPSVAQIQSWVGELRAHDEVALAFRADGRVLNRTADVGDHVQAGQVIAVLESATSQNQLASAQADLSSAVAAEQVASLNLKRMTQLMPSGAIARVQLDSARAEWQAAVSRRQSGQAALNNARDNLAWTRLTAPAAGIITQVSASTGQVVTAGQTIASLAVNSGRDAVFDVADPQIFSSASPASLTVTSLTDPTVVLRGTLRDISPQADPQTRTWRVRVTIDKPPAALALGAMVQTERRQPGPALIRLPASALTRLNDTAAVFVVDKKSRQLQRRPVTLGQFTASDIWVAEGIQSGERVVTAGVSTLRQGEIVSLSEADQ